MLRKRAVGFENFLVIGKILTLNVVFWGVYLFVSAISDASSSYPPERYLLYAIVTTAGLLLASMRGTASDPAARRMEFTRAFGSGVRDVLYVAGALGANLVLTKDVGISRLFLLLFLGLLFPALIAYDRWFPQLIIRWLYHGKQLHRTLLVGPITRAQKLKGWLDSVSEYGMSVRGILTEHATPGETIESLSVLGAPAELEQILAREKIHTVILLRTPAIAELRNTMELVEDAGARLVVLNTLAEDIERPLQYYRHIGVDFFTFREEPLQDPANRFIKRLFDLAIASGVVLFLLPPLALVVWLMQRLQAPGPLLYRQQRAGVENEPFVIYKFRTMRVDNADVAKQATADDDRIFPFGRFLRRSSLDEIPQFLNVLFGHMSVVGPRPHMIEHNARFAKVMRTYHIRTFVRPGITGLAQIRGFRGEAHTSEDIRRRVECDIDYIERWSATLDLQIVLRTFVQIFRPPKSAY
jgi:exopolysaccharide biosynthesis polyprenyl glycosylphosphotransferase